MIVGKMHGSAGEIHAELFEVHHKRQVFLCGDAQRARITSRLLHEACHELPGAALSGVLDVSLDYSRIPSMAAEDFACLAAEDILEAGARLSPGQDIACEIVSLVDTGHRHGDLMTALSRLEVFGRALGRPDAPDSVFGELSKRIGLLRDEHQLCADDANEAAFLSAAMAESKERLSALALILEERRGMLAAATVVQAEGLQRQLDEQTAELEGMCREPGIAPAHLVALQKVETELGTARLQMQRTRGELAEVAGEESDDASATALGLPGEETAGTHAALSRITELNGRIDEVNASIAAQDKQICAIQEQLSELPDFTRIAPNPVDWLTQLARSFSIALKACEEEREKCEQLRAQLADARVAFAGDAALFQSQHNLAESLKEYENKKRASESNRALHDERIQQNESIISGARETLPGLITLGAGCASFLIVLLGFYVQQGKAPILYAAGILLVAAVFFVVQLLRTRALMRGLAKQVAADRVSLDALLQSASGEESEVDRLLRRSGCATVRELEARYDTYREMRRRVGALEEQLRSKERDLEESNDRVPRLFARVCATLEQVHEVPANERDVEAAVGQAIGKYQVFRETKRRLADLRNHHQRLLGRRRYLKKELLAQQEQLLQAKDNARTVTGDRGGEGETDVRNSDSAISEVARKSGSRGNIGHGRELRREQRRILAERLQKEESLVAECERRLAALLEEAGLETPEQARDASRNETLARELELRRSMTEEALDDALQGRSLDDWRAMARGWTGKTDLAEMLELDACREDLARAEDAHAEAQRAYRRLAGQRKDIICRHRSLTEIEEDIAHAELALDEARRGVSSAAAAMALIDELLPSIRAQAAEALVGAAAPLLRTLGVSAEPHLEISMESPPEISVESAPPADQWSAVYLAFRLAIFGWLHGADQAFPLIVDATMQGAAFPFSFDVFCKAIDTGASDAQALLITDEPALAAAAEQAGWALAVL